MKKVLLAVTCALSVGLFFNSCSMEKRHYMPGYHFDWNKNANHSVVKANDNTVPVQTSAVTEQTTSNVVVAAQPVQTENTIAPVAVETQATTTTSGFHSVTKSVVNTVSADQVTKVKSNSTVVKQALKAAKKPAQGGDVPKGLLYVLCILIPWLAVGLATDWDVKKVIINLLWSLTCIGGIIHAFIVVSKS